MKHLSKVIEYLKDYIKILKENDFEKEEEIISLAMENKKKYDPILDKSEKYLKKTFNDEKKEVPDYMIDKINMELMKYPVINSSGISYEKKELLKAYSVKGYIDPITNEALTEDNYLIENKVLKKHIKHYQMINKWAYLGTDIETNWKLFEFK